MQVHKRIFYVGDVFKAPANVTFAWQPAANAFAMWYSSKDACDTHYTIVATGELIPKGVKVRASVVLPDGFHVFHLVELQNENT